jgi:ABC-type lipoprotein export system ATPase subunit
MLKVQEVKKNYHSGKVLVPALRCVSFGAKESAFVTIFGLSGNGKSRAHRPWHVSNRNCSSRRNK